MAWITRFLSALVFCASCVRIDATRVDDMTLDMFVFVPRACSTEFAEKFTQEAIAIQTLKRGSDTFRVIWDRPTTMKDARPQYVSPGIVIYPNLSGSYLRDIRIEFQHSSEDAVENGVNARAVLGSDWQAAVERGVPESCL